MTFGRWILIHSFSIFLVGILVAGYIYREELLLDKAYNQLIGAVDNEARTIAQIHSMPVNGGKPQQEKTSEPVASPEPLIIAEKVEEKQVKTNDPEPLISSKPTIDKPFVEENVPVQGDLLIEARRAFWSKNYDKSLQLYQQLIEKEPRNADYLGELGNIYYSMNDFRMASEVYFDTANLLLDQGNKGQARQLLSPVTAMDRQLGDQLRHRLQNE